MEPLPSFWPHRGIALGAFVWFGKRAPPQDVLCSPSTPERQSLFESHRQRRGLTRWSYSGNRLKLISRIPWLQKPSFQVFSLSSKAINNTGSVALLGSFWIAVVIMGLLLHSNTVYGYGKEAYRQRPV